jgi:hypothetical protein
MKELTRRLEWTAIGGVAVFAFVLGVLGMRVQMMAQGLDASWSDAVYFSLRLFGLEFDLEGTEGSPYAAGNWLLEMARFLAPATLAYAVVKGLMLAAAYQLNLWRVSGWQEHAVICGAGERGRQLAVTLLKEGVRVIVIEKDGQADTLADIRDAGGRVIRGSGTDPARQADARLEYASVVAAVTPCEESNLEVVLAASRRRTGLPLRALAHATRSFAEMFENQAPFDRIKNSMECGFFDHDVAAARLLVMQYMPSLALTMLDETRAPRLLLAGDGDILPELLAVIVTQCQYAEAPVPQIDLVTNDTDAFAREFPLHHPQLGLVADLSLHVMPLPLIMRLDLTTLRNSVPEKPYDLAFVACREDIDTLSLAKRLAQQAGCVRQDVVAGLRPSTQLMRLFVGKQPLAGVRTHDLVALGCSAEIVLHGRLDQVAREIHEAYLSDQTANGRAVGSAPALVLWEDLPEGLRQANRSQADHMAIKRCTLAVSDSVKMIESLAIAEHRRWMAEKIVANWRHAPVRDDTRRLHPSIRPYEELSEEEKHKDRNTVRAALRGGQGAIIMAGNP